MIDTACAVLHRDAHGNPMPCPDRATASRPQTVREFAEQYAKRSGTTVELLLSLGQQFMVCHCEQVGCPGWQATSRPETDLELGRVTQDEFDARLTAP